MNSDIFTQDVLTVLHNAGWHQSRSVEVTLYLSCLREEGFTVFPCVSEFLQSFGGIHFYYPDSRGRITDIDFDLCNTSAKDYKAVQEDSEVVGVELCPVGACDEDWGYLMMDKEGRTYVRYENSMYLAGKTGCEAIQSLVFNNYEVMKLIIG